MRTHDHVRPDTSPRSLPRERKTGPSATSYHPLPLFPVFSSLHRTLGREKRGSLALYQKWEGRFQETHPEVGGDCKNVRLAWDFLAGRPLRQTCLLAPVLIWIGKGRTGEAGREEGLPLEQLTYLLFSLARIWEFFRVNAENGSCSWAILQDCLSLSGWLLVNGGQKVGGRGWARAGLRSTSEKLCGEEVLQGPWENSHTSQH